VGGKPDAVAIPPLQLMRERHEWRHITVRARDHDQHIQGRDVLAELHDRVD
jgi:hypothetical protein